MAGATVRSVTDESLPEGAVPVRVRRAARYRPFALTGAAVGLLVAVVLTFVARENQGGEFTLESLLGYLAAIGVLLGGLLGAGVALLAERKSR